MITPTPTPGALSAARELHSENWSVMTYDQMVISGALIIDRHTARTDVDALVKALEDMATSLERNARDLRGGNGYADPSLQRERNASAGTSEYCAIEIRSALARHAKGGATG